MSAFKDVKVGKDTCRVTVFNPYDELTVMKCQFLLEQILTRDYSEAEFRNWLKQQQYGPEILEALKQGVEPVKNDMFSVNPLNARAEVEILNGILKGNKKCPHCKS